MNHKNIQEQISQFMDNELPKEEQSGLFLHLSQCDECREFFAETKKIHDLVKTVEYHPVPETLDAKFGVLGMNETPKQFGDRTLTISIPSALITVGAAILMTLFIYIAGNFQEKSLLAQYRQTMSYTGQINIGPSNNN